MHAPATGISAGLADGRYIAGFRANHLSLAGQQDGQVAEFACRLGGTEITGAETYLHLTRGEGFAMTDESESAWVGLIHGVHDLPRGAEVRIAVDPSFVYLFTEAGALAAPASYAMAG